MILAKTDEQSNDALLLLLFKIVALCEHVFLFLLKIFNPTVDVFCFSEDDRTDDEATTCASLLRSHQSYDGAG
jgi:hypothetical protein